MKIKQGYLKILDCFDVRGMGLVTEIQHNEKGIPPNSQILDKESNESWEVKKRIFNGLLLTSRKEILFDSETEVTHISPTFKNKDEKENQISQEVKKRERGIYWYLIISNEKNKILKPEKGKIMQIKITTP